YQKRRQLKMYTEESPLFICLLLQLKYFHTKYRFHGQVFLIPQGQGTGKKAEGSTHTTPGQDMNLVLRLDVKSLSGVHLGILRFEFSKEKTISDFESVNLLRRELAVTPSGTMAKDYTRRKLMLSGFMKHCFGTNIEITHFDTREERSALGLNDTCFG
ncbi:hypothetical protein ACJX0J_034130, partial [Zea mays]